MSDPKHWQVYFAYFGGGRWEYTPCEVCGIRPANHIHHIEHGANGRKNDIENLAAVCYHCHDQIHNREGGAEINRLLKTSHKKLVEERKK